MTTPPLPPEIYIYHFSVDGITRADASNPTVVHSLSNLSNMVEVSGDGPQLWDARDVPHGVVHHHQYKTATVLGLENNESDYFVYTPPGYDATGKKTYPVLYLLHGWGAGASGWTAVGQAQQILDNLLAEGKIKPMVVVMPLGYGDMTFVKDWGVWNRPAEIDHNVALCEKALPTEVMPQVEAQYKVSKKREERAIAGFSMGGLQALSTGLTHTDMFAYVGGFSSAVHVLKPDQVFAGLNPATANLKVLWVACGVDDQLIAPNRRLVEWLKTKSIPVAQIETPGRHAWPVWRDNLIQFTHCCLGRSSTVKTAFAARWLAAFCCVGVVTLAQTPAGFRSTEVNPDRRVTFHFAAPQAAKVELLLEDRAPRLPMQKGGDGVWSVTTGSLAPEIYGYRFSVDGQATVRDPQNPAKRYGNSLLVLSGDPPQPWERTQAPRGRVTRQSYVTKTVVGLPENRSEFVVYTPPGYDPKARPYPVLYLLHVWGDEPGSWVEFGQADVILDNLIAQGKARPMVVVMPLGYGEMSFSKDYGLWNDRAAVARNLDLFSKALLTEVMPQVEQGYNVRRDSAGRAILGASMGGLESIAIGLMHPETFAWVGGESSALQRQDFAVLLAGFNPKAPGRRLVWMVCGKDDELAGDNRRLVAWLKAKGQPVDFAEPEGTHSYIVWREGLVRFAQMIF